MKLNFKFFNKKNMEKDILQIKLSSIEFHLFHGGWKIHHIVKDEDFKSQAWRGIKIHEDKVDGGSYTIYTDNDKINSRTQDFEIIPANMSDLHYWTIRIDGKEVVKQSRFSTKGQGLLTDLQKNEGLTAYEFHNKKFDLHSDNLKYFSGKIVHFTDFKYMV